MPLGRYASLAAFATSLVAGFASLAHAVVVEQNGATSIDWSTLRLRVYGDAVANKEDGDLAFKQAEKRARVAGLEALKSEAATAALKTSGISINTNGLVNSAVSSGTTYFGDGTVRVYLEANLSEAGAAVTGTSFARDDLADATGAEVTGIVFTVDHKAKPRATYKVIAEDGAVLYDASLMASAAFKRNLMGRWLSRPAPSELAALVGARPAQVHLASAGDGVFRVTRAEWEAALKGASPLLINGTIALIQQ